jgi:hypothetical protein
MPSYIGHVQCHALEWNSNRCNTEPEALKQNTSEPTNAAVDREAGVNININ